MSFFSAKCKILLQDWTDPLPSLCIANHQLEVCESFTYLGSCIAPGGKIEEEISQRIAKARLAFSGLRHLWRRRDVSLRLKGRVYETTVRAVLLYGGEAWPLRQEDIRRLSTFDHRCLRSLARVWWQDGTRNEDVRRKVLGEASHQLSDQISLCRLRWLGHVLRMPEHRLPRRALFAIPGPGWKRRRGGQPKTWRKDMKRLTSPLAVVGTARLPGWGPKENDDTWLTTLEVMARERVQWRECCRVCIPPPTDYIL